MPNMPNGFVESPLGELKGAIRQYRGPDGLHLREYVDGYELHRDVGDPRTPGGFILHIFVDAPEVGIALLRAIGSFNEAYEKTNSFWDALAEAFKTSVLTYVGVRIVQEFVMCLIKHVSSKN